MKTRRWAVAAEVRRTRAPQRRSRGPTYWCRDRRAGGPGSGYRRRPRLRVRAASRRPYRLGARRPANSQARRLRYVLLCHRTLAGGFPRDPSPFLRLVTSAATFSRRLQMPRAAGLSRSRHSPTYRPLELPLPARLSFTPPDFIPDTLRWQCDGRATLSCWIDRCDRLRHIATAWPAPWEPLSHLP